MEIFKGRIAAIDYNSSIAGKEISSGTPAYR